MHRLISCRTAALRGAGLGVLAAHLWLAGGALASRPADGEYDWGPLASRMRDLNGDLRFRAAGPFVEKAVSPRGDTLSAVRPFYVRAKEVDTGFTRYEFVWPLCVAREFKEDFSWRFLTAIYVDFDRSDPDSRYRFWLFPLWFQGRDKALEPYAGLFPLIGHVREILVQDEIRFFLWPLWTTSRINDVKSRHVLWPIFSHTTGEGLVRYRAFPLYGYSRKEDSFEKRFILWPFWTSVEYMYPTSRGKGFVLFPLYGRIRLTDESTLFLAPPFFRFSRTSRGQTIHAPWPIFQYKSGEQSRLYFFPLWGHRVLPGNDQVHYLWPIARTYRVDQGDTVLRGVKVLPFYIAEKKHAQPTKPGEKPEVRSRWVKLWPLGSYRREGEVARWRALELWPFRERGPVERGYVPFWTLASRTWSPEGVDSEWFWGLYRHRRRGDASYYSLFPLLDVSRDASAGREINLFKGLLGYRREEGAKSVRLLYLLRLGGGGSAKTPPAPAPAAAGASENEP